MYSVLLVLLAAQFTATLRTPPNRSPEVEIRTDSTQPLTAFAIRMEPTSPDAEPFIAFFDVVTDPAPLPLRVEIPARRVAGAWQSLYTPPILSAALFADGTSSGDPTLLNSLKLRRASMLQAVELARDMLATAGKRNVPRAQLTKQFQQLADSLNHWYLPPEQQVGRTVYQSIVGKLLGLPDQRLGDPFPPTTFVTQEVAALDRQRTTLIAAIPR
jgi:hypothetical protein